MSRQRNRPEAAAATALACVAAAIGGCDGLGSADPLVGRLQSGDPSVRIAACVQAAESSDGRTLPLLVDRLEDNSADVRMFAIRALEKKTGQTFGYVAYADAADRAAAVRRWRQWLRSNSPGGPGE